MPEAHGAEQLRIIEPLCAVFRRKLRQEGLKYTAERAHVLDAVLGMQGVFPAEKVIEAVAGAPVRVSKATVYRTIRLLVDAGIVQRVPMEQDQAVYHLAFGPGSHDLLIRVDTGETFPIDAPELARLRDQVCRAHGLSARGHRFHVYAAGPEAGGTP